MSVTHHASADKACLTGFLTLRDQAHPPRNRVELALRVKFQLLSLIQLWTQQHMVLSLYYLHATSGWKPTIQTYKERVQRAELYVQWTPIP